MTDDEQAGQQSPPMLRVVRGDPTPEELAAVVAVLAAAGSSTPSTPEPRGQWRSRGRNVRPSLSRGHDAWRSSGLPR